MNKILVIGGAGYIGSHMVKLLATSGYEVVTLDNLSQGHRDAVLYGEFVEADIADSGSLEQVFSDSQFDAVMHFASYIQVGESLNDPAKYYTNNVANTQRLLDAMVKHGIYNFIFSSMAAIFGEPKYIPIDEQHPVIPINPYGRSKLFVEQILEDYDKAYGLKSICLRYFNAAGADPSCQLGERHDPETHLIPLILQVASGRKDSIKVFGRDYNTIDGTCIRDYVHVVDLCAAHLFALEKLYETRSSDRFNLGNGQGFSVQEVINSAIRVTGQGVSVVDIERRAGDPAVLIADNKKAKSVLGWVPVYKDIDTIISHAWEWEKKLWSL